MCIKNKFTLIELLIVIAIIGMLTTILFPSLSIARENSKALVCTSNMKQISIAIELFKKDNNHRLPKAVALSNTTNWPNMGHYQSWRNDINSYLADGEESYYDDIFACPSKVNLGGWDAGGMGWNIGMAWGKVNTNTPSELVKGIRFERIEIPSETVLIGDTLDLPGWRNNVIIDPNGAASNVSNRHLGKTNILWANGNVSKMSPSKLAQGKESRINYYYLLFKEQQSWIDRFWIFM